jgi:3-isopropylmalate/(R)-2-methylmalate dehydratase small subunit
MLPVTLDEELVKDIMGRTKLTVDLGTQMITDESGLAVRFEVSEFQRYCLLEGLDDIGLTLKHEDAITAYETLNRKMVV